MKSDYRLTKVSTRWDVQICHGEKHGGFREFPTRNDALTFCSSAHDWFAKRDREHDVTFHEWDGSEWVPLPLDWANGKDNQ